MNQLTVLDLFSGIGGFSLGLECAGFKTLAFCEIEPYCQRVLRKHWPDIPIYEDVRTLTKTRLDADGITPNVVCGGFPCQDISAAGRQKGITAARSGLWFEFTRILSEIRPRWAIIENVGALRSGKDQWSVDNREEPHIDTWFGRILGELAEIGYNAEWHCISASAIGAEHYRDRLWIVAYPSSAGLQGLHQARWQEYMQSIKEDFWRNGRAKPDIYRKINGLPKPVDRLRALGNAIVPQIAELIGRAIRDAHDL